MEEMTSWPQLARREWTIHVPMDTTLQLFRKYILMVLISSNIDIAPGGICKMAASDAYMRWDHLSERMNYKVLNGLSINV